MRQTYSAPLSYAWRTAIHFGGIQRWTNERILSRLRANTSLSTPRGALPIYGHGSASWTRSTSSKPTLSWMRSRNPMVWTLPYRFLLHAPSVTGNYFFLEIFSGSGRLSSSLGTHFRNVGRQIKVIHFDIKANPDDDILRSEIFNKLQTLINSGYCVGVWFAPPCSSWSYGHRRDVTAATSTLHHSGVPSIFTACQT